MKRPTVTSGHSSCISAEELLLYKKEGELTDERLEVVERHLESCLLCLDALLRVTDDSGEDEPVKVPADFMMKLNQIAREAWQNMPAKRPPARR
jgi:hypothetical protein